MHNSVSGVTCRFKKDIVNLLWIYFQVNKDGLAGHIIRPSNHYRKNYCKGFHQLVKLEPYIYWLMYLQTIVDWHSQLWKKYL